MAEGQEGGAAEPLLPGVGQAPGDDLEGRVGHRGGPKSDARSARLQLEELWLVVRGALGKERQGPAAGEQLAGSRERLAVT